MSKLKTLNDVAFSSTIIPQSDYRLTEHISVDTNSPFQWYGGLVQNFNFQVGFNASSPSKLSVRVIDDENHILDTSYFAMGNFVSCPLGTYTWYGVVQSCDREMEARDTQAGVVGYPNTFVTMESFRGVMDTVKCVLSPMGLIFSVQENGINRPDNMLDVFTLAWGDADIQYSGYYRWREGLGMPWNTFRKALSRPDATFKYHNDTFRVVWNIPSDSIFNNWDSNVWLNNETAGLAEAIDGYISQKSAVWIDEVTESAAPGVDYDLNIWIYERTTDATVSQADIGLICNSSDILFDANKINNISNITWGSEQRRENTRYTMAGAPVEFMQKYDVTDYTFPHIVIPDTKQTLLSYYGLGSNARYIFPYFGIHNIPSCGIEIDILSKEMNSYDVKYMAVQPYITKLYENDGFSFQGALSIQNGGVPSTDTTMVSASAPTVNASQSTCNLYIDSLFYYNMIGNCRGMDGLYNFYFDCMKPVISNGVWSFVFQSSLAFCSPTVKSAFEDIWDYIHEPIGALIYGGRVATRDDSGKYHKIPNEMDASCYVLKNFMLTLPDTLDFKHANDTISYVFSRSDGTTYTTSATQYNLWQAYCRLKHVSEQLDKLAGEFLNSWMAVMPQDVSYTRKDRHALNWSTFIPDVNSHINDTALESFDCHATQSAWPWSLTNGFLNVPIWPESLKNNYNYDLTLLWTNWGSQSILWSLIDPTTFKLPACSVWEIDPSVKYIYTAEGDVLIQDNTSQASQLGYVNLAVDKTIKIASPVSVGEPLWIIVTPYSHWTTIQNSNNIVVVLKVPSGYSNALIAQTYFSLTPFTLGSRISYKDKWFVPGLGPAIGGTLDGLDGTCQYRPIPSEIYLPFVFKNMRYGIYTNCSAAEEVSNTFINTLSIDDQFSPWAFGGDIEMYRNIQWWLINRKSNLTYLDRFQIQAFDYFRPIATVNPNNKSVRFRPGLNIIENSDVLMTDLVSSFGENGWSYTANFASYVRKPNQMNQSNFDTLYRMQKYADRTKSVIMSKEKQLAELFTNQMPYTNYGAGMTNIDQLIRSFGGKQSCLIKLKDAAPST